MFFKRNRCKVNIIGRGGVEYHLNGHVMEIDGEMLTGPEYDIMLFKNDISKWRPPYDNDAVSEEERAQIINDVEARLKRVKILWR